VRFTDVPTEVRKYAALPVVGPYVCVNDRNSLPERWIWDTGTGNDLIGKEDLSAAAKREMIPIPSPLYLNTAAGVVGVDKKVALQSVALEDTVGPLVLASSPPVLSCGRRCMVEGYSFHWEKFCNPYLVLPSGKRRELEVQDYVPYLREHFCGGRPDSPAAPAVANHPVPAPTPKLKESKAKRREPKKVREARRKTFLPSASPAPAETPAEAEARRATIREVDKSYVMVKAADALEKARGGDPAPLTGASPPPAELTCGECSEEETGGSRDLRAEALSLAHLLTHCVPES